ncbi:hypothetical protein DFH06DRAFT_1291302 [Mycena polygramma]|nr:hypothetical protein DFH06DRAFT_1291302 [Mycena polygramma]
MAACPSLLATYLKTEGAAKPPSGLPAAGGSASCASSGIAPQTRLRTIGATKRPIKRAGITTQGSKNQAYWTWSAFAGGCSLQFCIRAEFAVCDVTEGWAYLAEPAGHSPNHASVGAVGPRALLASRAQLSTEARARGVGSFPHIWTLREALDKLLAEREAFKLYTAQCSSLFAPIRSLPPEILLKIFAYCSRPWDFRPPGEVASREHMERLAKAPLPELSKVCSVWRAIIMQTPSLWAAIEINLNEWLLPSVERRARHLLAVAVERTAAYPLQVKVTATSDPYFGDPGMVLLGQCSQRWQTAYLLVNSAAFRAISFTKEAFPLLETLDIHGQFLSRVNIFEVAPRLRHVTLRAYGATEPPSLPWEQLTTFNYESNGSPGLRSFMGLIHRCTSLTAVRLLVNVSRLDPPLALPPVHTDLTCLAITLQNIGDSDWTHAAEEFSEIIGSFTLPSIRKLAIRMNFPRVPTWPQGDFMSFAARSAFRDTVTSLALHNILIADVELLVCLGELAQLESLEIADVPRTDDESTDHVVVTNVLLQQLTDTILAPHLHVVRLASLLQFTPQTLLKFLASRVLSGRTAAGPFELEVDWNPQLGASPDPELVEQLDALQRTRDIAYWMVSSTDAFAKKRWLDV